MLIHSISDWESWAFAHREVLSGVVAIRGEMGAGKTTAVTAWLRALGSDAKGSSPTFGLCHHYDVPGLGQVRHFDLYRLDDEDEAETIGIVEDLDSGAPCWIEWPEKIPNLLPANTTLLDIEVQEDGVRRVTLNTLT